MNEYKIQQLCRQVERALHLAIEGEPMDPLIAQCSVLEVQPMGGGTFLVLIGMRNDDPEQRDQAWKALNQHSGRLRSVVAAQIHRKRTPQLMFRVINTALDAGAAQEGERHAD